MGRAFCVWNNGELRAFLGLLLALFALESVAVCSDEMTDAPKLLLTPQRLRRLQRDRERQTVRWVNFENRVQAVSDSPERGFELALYYAVTRNAKVAKEAVSWAIRNPKSTRQVALIADWCQPSLTEAERAPLRKQLIDSTGGTPASAETLRNAAFARVVLGQDLADLGGPGWAATLAGFEAHLPSAPTLYTAVEFLDTMSHMARSDLRKDDVPFFMALPAEFLLAMKPDTLDQATWQARAAALALVNLDTNMVNSQFLQSWGMEDNQMMREGEGVAYEFLWGNPYLPGVSYQNLDPWSYDEHGRLYGRTDWTPSACWIAIGPGTTQDQNCAPDWKTRPLVIGRLTLIPVKDACVEIPKPVGGTVIVWQFKPGQKLYRRKTDKADKSPPHQADVAGMFRVPIETEGKICTSERLLH